MVAIVLLYSSDYVLTIVSSRLYKRRAKHTILFEGSFELNPRLQKDVDEGRWFSRKWLTSVATLCILFSAFWWVCRATGPMELYLFVLGGMVFVQVALHTRHFRNVFLFATAFGDDGIRGRVEYPRWVVLATSAFDLLTFAGVFGIAYLLTRSIMLLGGGVLCLCVAAQHYVLRRRLSEGVVAAQHPDGRVGNRRGTP